MVKWEEYKKGDLFNPQSLESQRARREHPPNPLLMAPLSTAMLSNLQVRNTGDPRGAFARYFAECLGVAGNTEFIQGHGNSLFNSVSSLLPSCIPTGIAEAQSLVSPHPWETYLGLQWLSHSV